MKLIQSFKSLYQFLIFTIVSLILMSKSKLKEQNYVSSIFDTSKKKLLLKKSTNYEMQFKTSSKLNG